MKPCTAFAAALFSMCCSIGTSASAANAPEIIGKVSPSVVTIEHDGGKSIGSGFFGSNHGKIATNLHVLVGAQSVIVTTKEGRLYRVSNAIQFDPLRDLAIIQIPDKSPALPLANSKSVRSGDSVIAIGAPKGLTMTATQGIVSAVRRSPDGATTQIQTDAPVNPGNSGGPLVSLRGEVVGLVTSKLTNSESLNFAVAADHVKELLSQPSLPIAIGELERTLQRQGHAQYSPMLPPASIWKSTGSGKIFKIEISGDKMTLVRLDSKQDNALGVYLRAELTRDGEMWRGGVEIKHAMFTEDGDPVHCTFTSRDYYKIRVLSGQALDVGSLELTVFANQPTVGACMFVAGGPLPSVRWVPASPYDAPITTYASERDETIRKKCAFLRNLLVEGQCGYIDTPYKRGYCGQLKLNFESLCR